MSYTRTPAVFPVVGRKIDTTEVYYTGRAGTDFVSTDQADAYLYSTVDAARARAQMLNAGTALHGITFSVPDDPLDGVTILPVAPDNLADIQEGEIYERSAFSPLELSELRNVWRIMSGSILRYGKNKPVNVVRFAGRK